MRPPAAPDRAAPKPRPRSESPPPGRNPGPNAKLAPSPARWRRAGAVAAAGLLLGGCAGPPSTLDPQGPRAAEIAWLWWVMLAIATAVYLAVTALLLHGLLRSRPDRPDGDGSPGRFGRLRERSSRLGGTLYLVISGIVVPAVIVVVLMALTARSMTAIAAPATPAAFTVDVRGFQYWWEVRYPDRGVTTANEIHVPVGEPVQVNLTSVDVIHSFWVPQLMGKTDLIPGRTNTTWIQADRPGMYRGECAEYCGAQHARMAFLVIAVPREEFLAWLDHQRRPAADPTDAVALAGQRAFMRPSCIGCHTIQGTPARGEVGPDLTHYASRRYLAAGSLPNNRGTTAGWIADPQGLKPGNLMPDLAIDLETANAIAAYLETLE